MQTRLRISSICVKCARKIRRERLLQFIQLNENINMYILLLITLLKFKNILFGKKMKLFNFVTERYLGRLVHDMIAKIFGQPNLRKADQVAAWDRQVVSRPFTRSFFFVHLIAACAPFHFIFGFYVFFSLYNHNRQP